MPAVQSDATDEMLMIRYQRGDRQAFAELVSRHARRVYNFVLRQLRDEGLAEDITQETFLRVVQSAAQFKNEARFATWLYGIVRSACLDHERRRPDRPPASSDGRLDPVGGRAAAGEKAPTTQLPDLLPESGPLDGAERSVVSSQVGASIVRVLGDLPDEQREVFLMREIANLPFEDIALITVAPVELVKSRMRYALDRLRDALSNFEEYARALR
jgi:RNA polymerase sigma-70 factor (ECF subfamily)